VVARCTVLIEDSTLLTAADTAPELSDRRRVVQLHHSDAELPPFLIGVDSFASADEPATEENNVVDQHEGVICPAETALVIDDQQPDPAGVHQVHQLGESVAPGLGARYRLVLDDQRPGAGHAELRQSGPYLALLVLAAFRALHVRTEPCVEHILFIHRIIPLGRRTWFVPP